MSRIVLFFIWSISLKITAQPDPKYFKENAFGSLTAQINKDPNNCSLIWERVKLSDLNRSNDTRTLERHPDKNQLFPYEDPSQLLDDINKLIRNDFSIVEYNDVYLKTLRGKLYDQTGKKNKAIKDYLSALKDCDSVKTDKYIKQELYISIAAYYYNLNRYIKKNNARQVLKHIDIVCPEVHLYLSDDCFESEKKEILKRLNEAQQLTNYFHKLILAEFDDFEGTKQYKYGQRIYNHEHYFRTLMRVYELVKFHKKNGDFQKSKNLEKQLLKFLPPNNEGILFKKFPKTNFYVWMDEYETNKPIDEWINKNKTKVSQYYQDFPEFIKSITSEK